MTDRTYLELVERAQGLLATGRSVIVDATFSRAKDRARFRALAKQANVPLALVICEAPERVIRERLEARVAAGQGPSDGRWDLYGRQRDAFEIPAELPARSVVSLNTEDPQDAVLARLLARLDEPLQ
jgi:predicted kinase